MRRYVKQWNLLKSILIVSLLVIIFISTVSFSSKYYKSETSSKLSEIETTISDVRGVMDLVSMRQHNVQKVLKIMGKYNKNLPTKDKYDIANEIHAMCLKYTNLNVDLICATITHESARTWQSDVVSPVGALGLMQIMPETGEELAQEEGVRWTTAEEVLFDPLNNIRLGCRYLSCLIQQYQVDGGLAAYNGGARRAKLWLAQRNDKTDLTLLWEETRTYVPTILKLYAEFQTQTGIL